MKNKFFLLLIVLSILLSALACVKTGPTCYRADGTPFQCPDYSKPDVMQQIRQGVSEMQNNASQAGSSWARQNSVDYGNDGYSCKSIFQNCQ